MLLWEKLLSMTIAHREARVAPNESDVANFSKVLPLIQSHPTHLYQVYSQNILLLSINPLQQPRLKTLSLYYNSIAMPSLHIVCYSMTYKVSRHQHLLTQLFYLTLGIASLSLYQSSQIARLLALAVRILHSSFYFILQLARRQEVSDLISPH